MKKIFIFLMIVFSTPLVFASNTNVSSKVRYNTSTGGGTYEGDEIALGGYNGKFNINTRYNGKLAMVSFYLSTNDYNFVTNHTYTITLNMATSDWRNNFMGPQVIEASSNGTLNSGLSVSNFRFVSMKQVKFNFKTDGSLPPYLFFRLYSTDYANPNGNSTAITGVNNWNLSSIYINNNVSATPTPAPVTPAPVTPAPTSTPQPNNKDIIDNANQNTQDIIDNAHQNTQDIIDNQNSNNTSIIENNTQNTSDIIDNNNENTDKIVDAVNNNQTCYYSSYNKNLLPDPSYWQKGDIEVNGLTPIDSYTYIRITTYIKVKPNTAYFLSYDTNWAWALIEYSSSNQVIKYNSLKTAPGRFVTSANTNYIKITTRYEPSNPAITPQDINTYHWQLTEGFSFSGYVQSKGSVVCVSKEDETTDAINQVNDSINNSNIDDKTGFFSDFEDNTHGLTGIITLPLSTIQSLTNNSCVPLSIPIPFTNSNVNLPCMTTVYETYIPSVYSVWQVVSFGIISYFICLDIFKMVKGFKDPNEDKIEVLDL